MSASSRPSYCAVQVRRRDPDRYYCALFAPAPRREALFALYAFNAEVARIRELVSEPILGLVRLEWWRETVAAIYDGRPPAHEVAGALARAVARHRLTRPHFERLLDARALDMDGAPPDDLRALIAYAEASSGGLVLLGLEILDPGDGEGRPAAQAAGRAIGIAWALVGLLRAAAFHARERRLYLPKALLEREGIAPDDVFALRPGPGLARVAAEIAAAAQAELRRARAGASEIPAWARPALLLGTLADLYLGRLQWAGYDLFSPRLAVAPPRRQLRLLAAALRGRF